MATSNYLLTLDHNTESLAELFEKSLKEKLVNLNRVESLDQAIQYVLLSGGKRIRPLLSLSLLLDLGGDLENFLPVCLALEYLHTSSLVHDDLPALDNDSIRRGKNTCHVEFDEATAILCGDILIGLAFECISDMQAKVKVKADLISVFSKAFRDLCYGQQLDLAKPATLEDLLSTAQFKTGALFSAVTTAPFWFTSASAEIISLAEEIGLNIGVCYQICDDFVDSKEEKNTSSDKRDGKVTFFLGRGSASSQQILMQTFARIKECLQLLEKKLNLPFANTRLFLSGMFSSFENMKVTF